VVVVQELEGEVGAVEPDIESLAQAEEGHGDRLGEARGLEAVRDHRGDLDARMAGESCGIGAGGTIGDGERGIERFGDSGGRYVGEEEIVAEEGGGDRLAVQEGLRGGEEARAVDLDGRGVLGEEGVRHSKDAGLGGRDGEGVGRGGALTDADEAEGDGAGG